MKHYSGFTMIEVVLSMMIISICSVVLHLSMKSLFMPTMHHNLLEDEIAIWQMRRLLAQSEELTFSSSELTFLYHDEECALKVKKGQIVHQIGNEIMMDHVTAASFIQKDHCIWLSFERNEVKREAVLICEI